MGGCSLTKNKIKVSKPDMSKYYKTGMGVEVNKKKKSG